MALLAATTQADATVVTFGLVQETTWQVSPATTTLAAAASEMSSEAAQMVSRNVDYDSALDFQR